MSETHEPWYADVVMPALLSAARRGYGRAMHEALDTAGFDDMPRAGMRMVGGIARNGPAGPDVGRQLGVRGERARTRLVDTLVERGYIEVEDGGDPEVPRYTLTARGRAAAEVSAAAARDFESRVQQRVGGADLATAARGPRRHGRAGRRSPWTGVRALLTPS